MMHALALQMHILQMQQQQLQLQQVLDIQPSCLFC